LKTLSDIIETYLLVVSNEDGLRSNIFPVLLIKDPFVSVKVRAFYLSSNILD